MTGLESWHARYYATEAPSGIFGPAIKCKSWKNVQLGRYSLNLFIGKACTVYAQKMSRLADGMGYISEEKEVI